MRRHLLDTSDEVVPLYVIDHEVLVIFIFPVQDDRMPLVFGGEEDFVFELQLLINHRPHAMLRSQNLLVLVRINSND